MVNISITQIYNELEELLKSLHILGIDIHESSCTELRFVYIMSSVYWFENLAATIA